MRKLFAVLAAAALAGGAWLVSEKYDIRSWDDLRLVLQHSGTEKPPAPAEPPVARTSETIRIASFNLDAFTAAKAAKPHVIARVAEILSRFDVAAVQEIRARDQDLLPRVVAAMNDAGRRYEYVISPRIGRSGVKEQYAYVFDTASVAVDRSEIYVVNDPDDLLHREPLVAWFRVRGLAPEAAFTFTLVNVHVDPDQAVEEVDELAQVFRAVQNDGRGEDDVILLGAFHVDDRYVGRLNDVPDLTWAISGLPTSTRGDAQHDNLVFSGRATNEFTGQTGVFDFLREFNLTLEEAMEISDHVPVWAAFSVYEGGRPGRVAASPQLSVPE